MDSAPFSVDAFDGRGGGWSRHRRPGPLAGRTTSPGVLPGVDVDRPGEDACAVVAEYRQRMNELALAWPRRVASLRSIDVGLAAVIAGLCLMDVWAPLSFVTREHHRPLLSLVFVAMSFALVWRRRAPLAVLAFVFTAG